MTVRPRIFNERFAELGRISAVLLEDTRLSVNHLKESAVRIGNDHSDENQARLDYRIKNVIRCLVGSVDGISYFLRQTVLDCAPKMGMMLEAEERRLLRKVRNPRGSLQHGYRYFGRLAGLDLQIDTTSAGWRALDELVDVRHGFSHPTEIRDLFALSAIHLLQPSLVWYFSLIGQLLYKVGVARGSLHQSGETSIPDVEIEEPVLRTALFDTFDSEFFDLVAQSAGRSIGYLNQCFRVLNRERNWARDELLAIPSGLDPRRQYQARVLAWSLASDIEGVSNLLRSELEKAARREEIDVTEEDRESMSAGLVEERAVSTAQVWSREIGYDRVPSETGADWMAVAQARGVRNRISHPKKFADLRVDLKQQAALLRAGTWFTDELLQSLLIHPDKWASKLKPK